MNLGVVYALQRKFNDAEQAYEEAIRLKPTMAEAYYNLGVFYEFHMRDPVRALVVYKKYLDLGGTDERVQRIVREVKK
jgi:tetratricopeptide (TPR) repeat protein